MPVSAIWFWHVIKTGLWERIVHVYGYRAQTLNYKAGTVSLVNLRNSTLGGFTWVNGCLKNTGFQGPKIQSGTLNRVINPDDRTDAV